MVGRSPTPSSTPWAFFDGEGPEASDGFTKLQNKEPVEEWFLDRGWAKAFLRTLTAVECLLVPGMCAFKILC